MSSRRRRAISIRWNGSGETPSGSRYRTALRLAIDGLIAIALAPQCAACRAPLESPTAGAVCAACWRAVDPISPLGCCSFPPHITLAASIGPYDEALKTIVQALKYHRRSSIARHLAQRMRIAGADVLAGADLVVPVPLHRARERTRGFNQARELARHLGVPMAEALVRVRDTAIQADLPATRRERNVHGAFALRAGLDVQDRVVVLVDDVSTTGATLNACASPLLAAGASEVRALTAARATLRAAARPR